jgi:hypothetical protein
VRNPRPAHTSFCAAVAVLCAIAPAGSGAESGDELDRWVPSLGIFSGVFGQTAEAAIMSSNTLTLTGPEPVRPATDGSDVLWSPFVGGNLELMTPGWHLIPGSPRLFVRGGADATFGFNRDIAKEGAPSQLKFPTLTPTQCTCLLDEREVPGQGSSLRAKVRSLELSAGAGIAFSFELGERRVRLKPSVEYMRTELELKGKVRRATLFSPGNEADPMAMPPIPERPTIFRFIPIDGEDDLTVDGLGAGLELEADAGRAGPFVLSLYLSGQAYRVIGDTEVSFTGTFTDLLGSQSSTWDFEIDPWYYRGGVGLRFRFVPEGRDWWPLR